MYVKHRNVWARDSRGNHPPHLQVAQSSLQWPPPEPQQTASTPATRRGAPAWVFSLEAQGLLLVPRPWSRITGPSLSKNPFFQYVYHGCSEAALF